ncbi:MAG: hypothetical protein JOY93_03105 [Acidobacteriales bacterium]|nr:hypothetical protein [Terriglobales bacterium]
MVSIVGNDTIVIRKPKLTALPILVVLFLFSYSLMTLLVIEQGRTIDSQRGLIQELFSDSSQLAAMKGKAFQKERADAAAAARVHPNGRPQSPQGTAPGNGKGNRVAGKSQKAAPQGPPKFASDVADERRSLNSI